MTFRLIPAFAALALTPLVAAAQYQATPTPIEIFEMAERGDWLVRVELAGGDTVAGRVDEVGERDVRIDDRLLALGAIVRIERGQETGGGGRMGMIAGGILLGTAFVILSTTLAGDSEFDVAVTAPAAIAGIASGMILGGLLGSELDPARVEWRQLWPGGW